MQPTLRRVAVGVWFGAMDGVRLTLIRRLVETGAAQAMRESAGLSRAEAGASARVHPITIFRWEHGERRPHGEAALRYLDLLEELSR
jgi:DNA-binding transcriptional regulator YiaG